MKNFTMMGAFIYTLPLKKWLFMANFTTLLILVALLQVSANSYSQTGEFNLKMSDVTILDVFKQIEAESSYRFFYDNDQIGLKRKISIEAEKEKITDILDFLLTDTGLTYEMMDNLILIRSKKAGSAQPKDSSQQQKSISGKVTDSGGIPLPGVTVLVKGTVRGAVTDANGNYFVSSIQEDDVLIFSFVGMKTQEFSAGGKSTIDVTMAEETIGIEEVVAVGYGTMKKSDLTGSVTNLSSERFEAQHVTDLSQAIQGRMAGVQLTTNAGDLAQRVKIRIRGANSLSGGNDPLIVVDGIALNINFSDLNVNDIASIDVLKDASATAIYGSRGANGVIMITTKSGKSGKSQIEVKATYGVNQLAKKLDLLNGPEYARTVNYYHPIVPPMFSEEELATLEQTGGTDWQDAIYRTGYTRDYQISAMDGNGKSNYYISGNVLDMEGILINTGKTKYSVRGNVSTSFNEKIKLSLNLYGNRTESHNISDGSNYGGGPIYAAMMFSPSNPIYDANGKYVLKDEYGIEAAKTNPYALAKEADSNNISNSLLANSDFSLEIFKGLTMNLIFGFNLNNNQGLGYNSTKLNVDPTEYAKANRSFRESFSWQNSNMLTYKNSFGKHDFSLMGVFEQSAYKSMGFGVTADGLAKEIFTYYSLALLPEPDGSYSASANYSEYALRSYLGRFNYSYAGKYLLTASFRADGSSKFQKTSNKWGYFPSFSLGWRVSEEGFLKDSDLLHNLKFRAGYGSTGNQAISPFSTLSLMTKVSVPFARNAQNLIPGVVPGFGNENVKWETTDQLDLGVDVSVLKGKVNFSVDYFDKTTRDVLVYVNNPLYDGGFSTVQNLGEISNKGMELDLEVIPVNTKNVTWNANFNISAYENKVVDMGMDKGRPRDSVFVKSPYIIIGDNPTILVLDKPMGNFWGYEWLGVYQSSEAAAAEEYGLKPGDNKYRDINNDKVIDGDDQTILGDANPKFTWGFNNTIRYKNLELNMLLQGVQGAKVWNLIHGAQSSITPVSLTIVNREAGENFWKPGRESNLYSNPLSTTGQNRINSSQWLEDASFVKLRNVSLAYYLRKSTLKFAEVKFNVSAQNLLTITNYTGYDPESTSINGEANWDAARGINLGAPPSSRMYYCGMTITF
jgi:TonB-dependent starch-binding outer membrane protein SusC